MAVKQHTPLRILPNRSQGDERASVEIYRPFFLAGMLSVLTAGCTLGAVALVGIAQRASYVASNWTPYVLAHANSQLYGWVGFFIIGFALQQHAPRLSRKVLFYRLAYASLVLMAIGIGLRFAAEPLAAVNPGVWVPVGVFSCILQVLAVGLFMVNNAVTRYKTGEGLTWQTKFVFASLFWWLVVVVAEPFVFYLSHQADPQRSIFFVAEWFPPYRDAQFLGFVSMMIFGVGLVKMNSCFGAEKAYRGLGNLAFVIWNASLILRMAGWVRYFESGMTPGENRLYVLGGMGIASAASLLVLSLRIFEPLSSKLPSHKFIRAAYVWLLIAGVMLVLEPVHLNRTGMPFSHAYIGAVRHALTVGFISQMIFGVGMHVVARMNDLPDSAEKPLWAAFILLNVGNAMRVFLQAMTDYTPAAFRWMGPSGFIELIGIVIWAYYMAGMMLRNRRKVSFA